MSPWHTCRQVAGWWPLTDSSASIQPSAVSCWADRSPVLPICPPPARGCHGTYWQVNRGTSGLPSWIVVTSRLTLGPRAEPPSARRSKTLLLYTSTADTSTCRLSVGSSESSLEGTAEREAQEGLEGGVQGADPRSEQSESSPQPLPLGPSHLPDAPWPQPAVLPQGHPSERLCASPCPATTLRGT